MYLLQRHRDRLIGWLLLAIADVVIVGMIAIYYLYGDKL
jgi:hypothetical protein